MLWIVQGTVYRGRRGARRVFTQLLHDMPQVSLELEAVFADDVLYRKTRSTTGRADDRIDTFVFHDGRIGVQTIPYHSLA